MLYRRDTRDKNKVGSTASSTRWQRLTGRIQADMLGAATARRNAFISDCTTLDQVRDVAQTGVARVPWEVVGAAGEQISQQAASRCAACNAATERCPKPMPTPVRSPTSPGPTDKR